jgi:hypothetical protein
MSSSGSKPSSTKEHGDSYVVDVENKLPEAAIDLNIESVDAKKLDVAGGFLARVAARPDAASLLAEYAPAEERKLLRKIDWIILPLCQVAVMMSAVDKGNMTRLAVFL